MWPAIRTSASTQTDNGSIFPSWATQILQREFARSTETLQLGGEPRHRGCGASDKFRRPFRRSRLVFRSGAADGREARANNTAFTFKGKAVDARQIGRELGVRYVLEGSVRRTGRTVRVNAQLIDAGSGAHLWAEQMDVDQGTLTTSQDNFGIASRLARTLSVELINVEGRRAPRANPDAVDLTMRVGRS